MSEDPMIGLFSSKTLVRLLSVFLLNPDRDYYQGELARMLGGPLRPVQLALDRLTRADVVSKRREGKQVYYQARATHPAFADLRSLFLKTFALGDVVRSSLEGIDGIEAAFVFGSTASAEQRSDSDVDVFVLGSVGRKRLAGALDDAERTLHREVNVSLYDRERLARAVREHDPFILDVLSKPKIWVAGDMRAFDRVAG
jgi:predicted nucleotidyltransferase